MEESAKFQKPEKKRAVVVDSEKEGKDLMKEHIVARRELEAKRVGLEEERFAFEWRVAERNDARALRQQEDDAKYLSLDQPRIELDVKRAAMYREERRSAMEQRKGMLAVLDALVRKLH